MVDPQTLKGIPLYDLGGVAGAILLAIFAGLTTLAYKHPKGYARLHEILWRVFTIIFFLYCVYEFGVLSGRSTMWPFVSADKFDAARASGPALEWVFVYPMLIFVATISYLGFLRYLPRLVGREDDYVPQSGFVIPLGREVKEPKPTNATNHPPKEGEADRSHGRSGRRIARGLPKPHPDTKDHSRLRQCLKTRDYRQLDAELVDAWLNTVEPSNKSKQ